MSNQEIIRRKQFCQIVNEITGSDQYLVVGIDVSKDKHHAFMGTATGVSLYRKLIFENNLEGFRRLLKTTDQIKVQHELHKIVFGVEPTGNYHKPLARHLIGCGSNLVLVSGQAAKNNRQQLDGRWDKHDTKCAANIADLVSRGRCLYYDCPNDQILELRVLLSLRRRLKKEEHSLRMRIRNHVLAQYFPELDSYYSASESESLAIVKWCVNPARISGMDFEQFFKMVTRTRRGTAQLLRLRKIYQLAMDSVGCPMGAAAEYEAQLLVDKLEQVRRQLKETEARMEDYALEFAEYSYLLSIPGFGPYISARVLASIGDPFRFDNRKQLLKMAGFDLCASRSGKTSDKAIPVISKQGNAELRYALYQAAKVASSRVELFRFYFAKMLRARERERGIITKMRVKLAAKMLVIAWTLMKCKEVFDPSYLNTD
jgi:transposase